MTRCLYVSLITLVDDFGRYEADAELIRSEAFPFGDPEGKELPVETVEQCLCQLSVSDMLVLYESDGKRFMQLTRWKERARTGSKFPDPQKCVLLSFANNCQQMFASPPSPSPSPAPTRAQMLANDGEVAEPGTTPDANIPTLTEVQAYASLHSVTPDSAKAFYDHHQGNNLWVNQHQRLINWKDKLVSWGVRDRAQPRGTSGSVNRPSGGHVQKSRNAGTYNEGRAAGYEKHVQ